jgi:hypothetical protein
VVITTFDPKCYELAKLYLPQDATEDQKKELAQAIQDTINEFISGLEG